MAEVSDCVMFEELATRDGHRLGVATLNAPASLNGLSLAMVKLLSARLTAWREQDEIVAVILCGAGDKAFCAGGDLQALYQSMLTYRTKGADDIFSNDYARNFFALEYALDYSIHSYPKPVVCWGHGYVMGGGMGLMAGASHRVVTETSRLAMPEVSIGLYPDVGGSWVLGRVPGGAGRFLALTAAQLDASDAIFAGLADHAVEHGRYADFIDVLRGQNWSHDRLNNDRMLYETLREFALDTQPGPLQRHFERIRKLIGHPVLDDAVAAIRQQETDDAWLNKAKAALETGAPSSMRLAWELQHRARHLSLADTFRLEYRVSLHCAAHGDFAEGVRALLIDKDRRPQWSHASLAEASPAWVESFFSASMPPSSRYPLADLIEGQSEETL